MHLEAMKGIIQSPVNTGYEAKATHIIMARLN